MSIPSYQELMLPVLQSVPQSGHISVSELVETIINRLEISDDDSNALLPSGRQRVITNRISWALIYMTRAHLLDRIGRGLYQLTGRGRTALDEKPKALSNEYLQKFDEFREFLKPSKNSNQLSTKPIDNSTDPRELLELSINELDRSLGSDLLDAVKKSPDSFFEQLVVDLLLKMGYGGSRVDAGKAIGRSGDGGIDGIIRQDRLGLDVIYIQATKWSSAKVGRPEVQKFAGSLDMHHATKGIFITTSFYTAEALSFANSIQKSIVLVDADELVRLMIEYNLGVSVVSSYDIKRLDLDFFEYS